ncbi:MAG TPA: S-layer homology domain-containing protein [Candidatus Scatomorpha pullicola]|nr:S-layer homology domain-containing protein [Candidatus Scatomorpha pullicola]
MLTSLSFTVAPAGADIELYYYWHDELRPVNREGNSYLVPNGTYRYVVSYGGYDSEYGDVTVSGTARTIRVQLDEHPEYRVYIANTEHGTVSVDTRYAEEGEWVYITVNPDAGYRLSDLTVTRPSGNTVKVEHVRGNVFRFAMPGVRVTVDAEFVRTTMPFTDVSRGQWFYDAVSFVYWRDIMDGVTSTQFAPDATTTRAMVVQILYRMAGSPTVRGSSPFYDVSNGAWYADAVIWAEANDIVNGMTTTTFAPNTAVTREQLATMLYRYAQYRHYNTSAGANTNILSYYDANRISEYAFSALQWACGEGIMDGTGTGYLSPQGQATRAQLAAMLMRFCMEYRI